MINDLKDLQKLFKLCRAQGITDFKMNGLELKLGEMPQQTSGQSINEDEITLNPYDGFPQEILNPEQLAHYASGGTIHDDPYLKKAT